MSTPVTIGRLTINLIEGVDTIAGSRTVINDNLKSLAEAVNSFQTYVNTEEKTITNIELVDIQKGKNPISDILIKTNGSISAGGNIVANLGLTASSAKIKNNVQIETGNLSLDNANSLMNVEGSFALGGEMIFKDFGSQIINAADKQTFTTNNWSNLVLDPQTNDVIGGSISLKGTNSIVLDFSEWVSAMDIRYCIDKIKFNTENITIGHKVLVMVLLGNNLAHTFTIMADTLKTWKDLTVGLEFNKSYQVAEIIFDGTNWVLLNWTPEAVIE